MSETMVYAGFWRRVAAYVVDAAILSVPYYGLVLAIAGAVAEDEPSQEISPLVGLLMALPYTALIASWLYGAVLESSVWQATLGKRLLGIRVTDLDGHRIGFGRATGRYFGKVLSGIILTIGFLMVAFTAKKQGLHDKMAGTLVVKKV